MKFQRRLDSTISIIHGDPIVLKIKPHPHATAENIKGLERQHTGASTAVEEDSGIELILGFWNFDYCVFECPLHVVEINEHECKY